MKDFIEHSDPKALSSTATVAVVQRASSPLMQDAVAPLRRTALLLADETATGSLELAVLADETSFSGQYARPRARGDDLLA